MSPRQLVLSNFQITDQPLFVGQSRLTAIYPVNLLFVGQGAIVTFVRYMDQIYMGLVVCPDLIQDPDNLMALLAAEFKAIGVNHPSNLQQLSMG